MEVIQISNTRGAGRYKEDVLIDLVKKALRESKNGHIAGYPLNAFIKTVYIGGEKPNMGALRKKIQEIGFKSGLGDVGVTIKKKKNEIGCDKKRQNGEGGDKMDKMLKTIIVKSNDDISFKSDKKIKIYNFYRYLSEINKNRTYWRYTISLHEMMTMFGYDNRNKLLADLRDVARKVVRTKGYFVIKYQRTKGKIMFISYK